ncbi:MAG: sodium:solute symporter family transporter, partial [Lentisphaeria bacterium]
LNSLHSAFPNIPEQFIANDMAYPAMLTRLGVGWTGLILATLLLAYISTIGTHLNHGINYLIEDCYGHFVNKEASERKHRLYHFIIMVIMLVISALIALNLKSAWQCFEILLLVGAGTGPVYLLRWLWWRITPRTEIVAMVSAIVMMVVLEFYPANKIFLFFKINPAYHSSVKLLLASGVTTLIWVIVTKLSTPTKDEVLIDFYVLTQPNSRGWRPIKRIVDKRILNDNLSKDSNYQTKANGKRYLKAESSVLLGGTKQSISLKILNIFMGTVTIYSFLFCVGSLVFQNYQLSVVLGAISLIGTWIIYSLNEQKK